MSHGPNDTNPMYNANTVSEHFKLPAPLLKFMHANFQVAFQDMQREANGINQAHGFNDDDLLVFEFEGYLKATGGRPEERFKPLVQMMQHARTGLKLMLIVTELSEALEGIRKNNKPDEHIPEFSAEEAELADAVIRIMNLATANNCRLAEAIVAKQEYNRTRTYQHGGKAF